MEGGSRLPTAKRPLVLVVLHITGTSLSAAMATESSRLASAVGLDTSGRCTLRDGEPAGYIVPGTRTGDVVSSTSLQSGGSDMGLIFVGGEGVL